MIDATKCYKKNTSVISKSVGSEIVLVPILNNTASLEEIFILNETGGYVWDCINGVNSAVTVKEMVTREFNISPKKAAEDINSFLKQLKKEGCIKAAEPGKKCAKTKKVLKEKGKISKTSSQRKPYKKPEINKVQLNSPEDTAAAPAAAIVVGVVGALVVTTPVKS
jgi:hypothetical protein